MNGPDLHPFLEEFRREHARVLARLAEFMMKSDWPEFFRSAVTEIHCGIEKREELFLFSAIATKAEIKTGGPLCMLYYDMHTASPPLLQAAAICGTKPVDPRSAPTSQRKRFYELGSPVCIPIEDHLALEQIVNHASEAARGPEEMGKLAAVYFQLLKRHFEKEDNCLLPMSQGLLTGPELDRLWESSRK